MNEGSLQTQYFSCLKKFMINCALNFCCFTLFRMCKCSSWWKGGKSASKFKPMYCDSSGNPRGYTSWGKKIIKRILLRSAFLHFQYIFLFADRCNLLIDVTLISHFTGGASIICWWKLSQVCKLWVCSQ